MAALKTKSAAHPAPARHSVSPALLLFALIAAPAAWLTQTVIGMAIARHACYPKDVPLDHPAFGYARDLLDTTIVCAAVFSLCAVVAALVAWSRTRSEKRGNGHELVEIGEGRTRFLAMCSLILSIGFSIALVFSTVGIAVIRLC